MALQIRASAFSSALVASKVSFSLSATPAEVVTAAVARCLGRRRAAVGRADPEAAVGGLADGRLDPEAAVGGMGPKAAVGGLDPMIADCSCDKVKME